MGDSLEGLLRQLETILRRAAVAGAAHASHELAEAARFAEALEGFGLQALAGQLVALSPGTTEGDQAENAARRLADALRSVDLALTYLLRPEDAPLADGLVAWPAGGAWMEPAPDLLAALKGRSELQWSLWLSDNRAALEGDAGRWLALAAQGEVATRRRAIQALGLLPTPTVIDALAGHLSEDRVARAAANALLSMGASHQAEVVVALARIMAPGQPGNPAARAAMVAYRLGAGEALAETEGHPNSAVRVYGALAAARDQPASIADARDRAAHLLAVCCLADLHERPLVDDELDEMLALGKQNLAGLCVLVADTPAGRALLARARQSVAGRAGSRHRQKACLVVGMLGDARDVTRLMVAARRGHSEAYEALGLLGGEANYQFLCDVLDGKHLPSHTGPAINALGALGDPRAVPRLIGLLDRQTLDRAAAAALGNIGDASAVPHLVARLSKAQPFEVNAFADALVRIGDVAAAEGFIAALMNFPGRIGVSRQTLVRGLVSFGDEAIDVVADALAHSDARVRAVAEEVLLGIGSELSCQILDTYVSQNPVERLLARLSHGSEDLRAQAGRELGAMSGQELAGLLAGAVSDCRERGKFIELQGLVKALERVQHPQVLPLLQELAYDRQAAVRRSAVTTLAAYPYVVNRETLVKRLAASRASDARSVVQILGQQDATVVDHVVRLLDDGTPTAQASALKVLGAQRARWAADFVLPLFGDGPHEVSIALAANIYHLSQPRLEEDIIARLLALLENASGSLLSSVTTALQVMACGSQRDDVHAALVAVWKRETRNPSRTLEAIGAIGHPEAREILLAELGSTARTAVQHTTNALARLGDPAAIPALEGAFGFVTATPAFRTLDEALSRLASGWHRLYRAQNAMVRGNPRAALEVVNSYVADNPENGDGYMERGRALHWLGQLSAAQDDYVQAARHVARPVVAWHAAGMAAHQLGDRQSALNHLDRALQARGEDGRARLRRGMLRLELGHTQAALDDFRVATTPGTAIVARQKRIASTLVEIVSHFADRPSWADLLGLMDRALPNRLADTVLIWALILTGRFTEAGHCLDRFSERWPDGRDHALLCTAWLYDAAGEPVRARETLEELELEVLQRGYSWGEYIRGAYADWPVISPSLTAMLIDSSKDSV